MILRLFIFIVVSILTALCIAERIRYVSTEHPVVTYYNKTIIGYINMTSRRHGRKDPLYYMDLSMELNVYISNNFSLNFYFYEFLTHRYERGFVEMHFKLCDLVQHDQLFGKAMQQGRMKGPCPFPPGPYHLKNMTMPVKHIPKNFPFQKGRIYCNATVTSSQQIVLSSYIDMEIKEWRIKN